MTVTLALPGYVACVAWLAPVLPVPFTRPGVSVRAGMAAWLRRSPWPC